MAKDTNSNGGNLSFEEKHKFRDRRGEVLFIDEQKMGLMVDCRHKELTDEEIQKIASNYYAKGLGYDV